jgi:hypothetical protein
MIVQKNTEPLKSTYVEKQFQEFFVPGKDTAIDNSTVGFKGKINTKTYNPKNQ